MLRQRPWVQNDHIIMGVVHDYMYPSTTHCQMTAEGVCVVCIPLYKYLYIYPHA